MIPTAIDPFVILCGIGYNTTIHEGLIIFEEAICFSGHHTRIVFEKSNDEPGSLWYLSFSDTYNRIPARHIVAAYKLVDALQQ